MPIVTWGAEAQLAPVRTRGELDDLLDELHANAQRRGTPEEVQLTVGEAGTLGMIVGAAWSALEHFPFGGVPPHKVSAGLDRRDGLFSSFMRGDHYALLPRRNVVPATDARRAMAHFLATGTLAADISWVDA